MAQDDGFDYSKAEFLYVGQSEVAQAAKNLGNLRQSFIQVGFTAEESFELIKLMLEINNKKG